MKLPRQLRKSIDHLYILTAPLRVSKLDYIAEGNKILETLSVCFVKQETFADLYTNTNARGKNLLLSTIHRSGPIGLFDAKNFDFFILKTSESEESQIWRYLSEDMGGENENEIREFKSKIFTKGSGKQVNTITQAEQAISMSDITWDKYDVVISVNFSIDQNIVEKFPNTLWCYMPQEPSMRHYKLSKKAPLFSYDTFLNQQFTYRLSKKRRHEINFPYNFMNSRSLNFARGPNSRTPEGTFIEIHSVKNLLESEISEISKYGTIRFTEEDLFSELLGKLCASKYFISLRKNKTKIWGNSMIDAIGAGLLAFGDPAEYVNLGLFTPYTIIKNAQDFVRKIDYLERNPNYYLEQVSIQRKLLDKYCYLEPLKSILKSRKLKFPGTSTP